MVEDVGLQRMERLVVEFVEALEVDLRKLSDEFSFGSPDSFGWREIRVLEVDAGGGYPPRPFERVPGLLLAADHLRPGHRATDDSGLLGGKRSHRAACNTGRR